MEQDNPSSEGKVQNFGWSRWDLGDQKSSQSFGNWSSKTRLGEFLIVVLILIECTCDVSKDVGMPFFSFIRMLFGFLEFPRSCMAVARNPPGDICSKPSFLGFLNEPPGSGVWSTRRRELGCPVLVASSFVLSVMLPWGPICVNMIFFMGVFDCE